MTEQKIAKLFPDEEHLFDEVSIPLQALSHDPNRNGRAEAKTVSNAKTETGRLDTVRTGDEFGAGIN